MDATKSVVLPTTDTQPDLKTGEIFSDDYTVFESPLKDFKQAVTAAGLENKVKYLNRGETYKFSVPVSL